MNVTRVLRQASAAQHRTPLIHFIGKRGPPKSIDHAPQAHPASPNQKLPNSFAAYREKAQQHGPLGFHGSSGTVGGIIGGHSGESLGSVEPPKGQFFDRSDLPERFRRMSWSAEEIEAVESGGASAFG